MKKVLLVNLIGFVCSASIVFAAPVRVPLFVGKTEGILSQYADGKLLLGVGADFEHVNKIKYKNSTDGNYNNASGVLSLSYDKKYSIYSSLGSILDPEFSIDSDSFKVKLDSAMMWGVGVNGILYEIEEFQIFADGNYRATTDIDIKKIVISGTEYDISALNATGKLQEWQLAVGVAKEINKITPYLGIKYFDSKLSGDANFSGTSYNFDVKNKSKVGVFLGAGINPLEGLELNIEGRFIDETAVMGNVTYMF